MFTGFPVAALDFYDDLELDNTRSFWEAHRQVYEESVRRPMLELTAALADEFGQAKVFRPYRDVRFAKDKTPYKTHQGAFVAVGPATGWYVQIGAPGVRVGAGWYRAEAPDLMAKATLLLATEPLDKVTGRVTYDQEILKVFGWISSGRGIGFERKGSGYSLI